MKAINRFIFYLLLLPALYTTMTSCRYENRQEKKKSSSEKQINKHRSRGLVLPDKKKVDAISFVRFTHYKRNEHFLQSASIPSFLPPAEDQEGQGSCVPFSVCYGLISYYEKRRAGYDYNTINGKADRSRVYSPSFIYNSIITGSNCLKGIDYVNAFNFISKKGDCTWEVFPYLEQGNSCGSLPGAAVINKAREKNYYEFFQVAPDLQRMKEFLSAGYPILIEIYSSRNMDTDGYAHAKSSTNPFIWNPANSDWDELHAMLCVDYNDSKGVFILFNSWGTDWGKDGYCEIPYSTFFYRVRHLFTAQINPGTATGGNKKKLEKSNFQSTPFNINHDVFSYYRDTNSHVNSLLNKDYQRILRDKNIDRKDSLFLKLKTYLFHSYK